MILLSHHSLYHKLNLIERTRKKNCQLLKMADKQDVFTNEDAQLLLEILNYTQKETSESRNHEEARQRQEPVETEHPQWEEDHLEAERIDASRRIRQAQEAERRAEEDVHSVDGSEHSQGAIRNEIIERDHEIRALQAEIARLKEESRQPEGHKGLDLQKALDGNETVYSQHSSYVETPNNNTLPTPRTNLRDPRRHSNHSNFPEKEAGDIFDEIIRVDPQALRPTYIRAYRDAKRKCQEYCQDAKKLPDRDYYEIEQFKKNCSLQLDLLLTAFQDIFESMLYLNQAGLDFARINERLDTETEGVQRSIDEVIAYCENLQGTYQEKTPISSTQKRDDRIDDHLPQLSRGRSTLNFRGRGGSRGRGRGRGQAGRSQMTPSFGHDRENSGNRPQMALSRNSYMGSHEKNTCPVDRSQRTLHCGDSLPHIHFDENNNDPPRRMQNPDRRKSSNRDFVVDDEAGRFEPYVRDESDEFYQQLPKPWNVLPSEEVNKSADFWKLLQAGMIHFNGTREGYIPFRSSFLNCVHRLNINMSYKVMALTSAFDDKVPELQELKTMAQHTPEGYRDVICALEREFGGRDRLVSYHIAKLTNAPDIKENDKRSLQIVSRLLHNYLNTLEGYGMATEVESSLLFKTIKEKLPKRYLLQYSQYIKLAGYEKSVQTILAWIDSILDDVIEVADMLHECAVPREHKCDQTTLPVKSMPRRRFNAFYSSELDENEMKILNVAHSSNECELDGEIHPIWRCEVFLNKSPHERRLHIYRSKRCLACLREGHTVDQCPEKFKCRHCGKSHNTLLHGTKPDHEEIEKSDQSMQPGIDEEDIQSQISDEEPTLEKQD